MSAFHHQRDEAIKQLYERGTTMSEIARRFGVTRGRVQQIVTREEFRASHRATMIARYGTNPNLSRLPDATPLEVMTLCDGKVQAWATRLMHLPFADPPIKTLGDLRQASDTQLLAVDGVGKKLVLELRRFCPADTAAPTFKRRKARNQASTALKMIRKVVQDHAPRGSVPSETGDGGFVKEAEALIEGILAIVKSKNK